MATKTDNHNPKAKLDLRRYFLRKYHADGSADVLDCCQGGGVMWGTLRREFEIARYWGVDLKPKKGRLKIDSVRILSQPGWSANVVDIDTYGSPWKHWLAMLPHVTRPVTVFLTIGQVKPAGGSPLMTTVRKAMGLGSLSVPNAIGAILNELAMPYLLKNGQISTTITEAVEAVADGNARYIGLRVEPKQKTPAEPVRTARRAGRKQVGKEPAHV